VELVRYIHLNQSTQFVVLLGGKKAGIQRHRTIKKAWCLAAIGEYFGKAWREDRQNGQLELAEE